MMWVRFPSGQCIQYNRAAYVTRSAEYSDLYTKEPAKGGTWIAQVPNSCIIEVEHACRVWNPLDAGPKDTETARELRSIKRKIGKSR